MEPDDYAVYCKKTFREYELNVNFPNLKKGEE